jgi:8-oxo-dGTP diphosphatase
MAPAMSYGLRAEGVLTKDGRDVLDMTGYRLLLALHVCGAQGAAGELGVSGTTVRRRVRMLESELGEKVLEKGRLNHLGRELLEHMELRIRLLDEQLEHLWRKPTLTCDGLLMRDGRLLLVRRGREPFKGHYALPGGILEYGESAEGCVVREMEEETGLNTEVICLAGIFSDPGRDPRGHFVTALYLLRETGGRLAAGDDAESAGFFDLDQLPPLAFDHSKLVEEGLRIASEHSL